MLMSGFFPISGGPMGHDYSYFLPHLLDGYFWWKINGLFSVPWFTPSFFGGAPFFSNPQSMYHSLPQALMIFMDPVSAIYVTVLLFTGIGFAGFYSLLAGPFRASPAASAYAAVMFMFNGFYISRMIIGHFAYHSFALTPWIVFFLVRQRAGLSALMRDVAAASLMLAYMASSGGLAMAPVMVTAILAAGLIHVAAFGGFRDFALRFSLSGAMAVGLSAAKIVAGHAFIAPFPREGAIPLVRDALGVVYIILSTLFLPTDGKVEATIMINSLYYIGPHELDYAVSPGPALLLLVGGYGALLRLGPSGLFRRLLTTQGVAGAVVVFLAALPLLLNHQSWFSSGLHASVPILKNSSIHLRWIAIYIPSVIILAALALEKSEPLAKRKEFYAVVGALILVMTGLARDWNYYRNQSYDPMPVITAYTKAAAPGFEPRINFIGQPGFKDGEATNRVHKSMEIAFTFGASPMKAYEPVFGYQLKKLPAVGLSPGAIMKDTNGFLNLRNPACFLYPEENGCLLGGRFTIAERNEAELFRSYRPFAFNVAPSQKIANAVSLLFIPIALLALLAPWISRRRVLSAGEEAGE
ncbi:MAG: hypothetical protein OEZ32_08560 [Nitrospinota bacterium]|nr:hypothetical protein [Nitrospinota bacterium]